jgi:Mg2+ and Co2+ transporter CorA
MLSDTLNNKIITNSDGLITMARAGQKMDYNRQVDIEKLKEVLPEDGGLHMEVRKDIHEHRHGMKVEPHYRLMWMVCTKDFQNDKKNLSFPIITLDTPIHVYMSCVTTFDKIPSEEEMLDKQIMEELQNA